MSGMKLGLGLREFLREKGFNPLLAKYILFGLNPQAKNFEGDRVVGL
jgi:hypothetical protein